MEISFRKRLYNSTKEQHVSVENVFNFKEDIHTENLSLFYDTMLVARCCCSEELKKLQASSGIELQNQELIESLKKDSKISDAELNSRVTEYNHALSSDSTLSSQLGMFYVMAGSSAGAKVLHSIIKEKNLETPIYYFTALIANAANQMNALKELFHTIQFNEDEVIESAQKTFNLIYKIASNELQRRTTQV